MIIVLAVLICIKCIKKCGSIVSYENVVGFKRKLERIMQRFFHWNLIFNTQFFFFNNAICNFIHILNFKD